MPSSTSRPGSFERRIRLLALTGIIGAPLVWLMAEEVAYALAYQACDAQSRSWVLVPTLAFTAIVFATFAVTLLAERKARTTREPQPLLAWMGIGIAAMMVVVMIASSIAPFLLRPCD